MIEFTFKTQINQCVNFLLSQRLLTLADNKTIISREYVRYSIPSISF